MRGPTTATLAILLLAVLCFISLPVFSSENPWDADGGSGKGSGSSSDSTTVPGDTNGSAVIMRSGANPGGSTGGSNLFTAFLISVSLQVADWLDTNSNQAQTSIRAEANKAKSHRNLARKYVD